jgi:UDP:flavonoid glycosyltransferase YjiC (YdhE family)
VHFTIFVYGTWGDIRPHVVLGMALKARGHDVQVVASPGYEAWVRARTLDFYPLSADVNSFAKDYASLMDANPVQQLRIARSMMTPIMTQMGLEVLDATCQSDVLMTVEFGAGLLFDVLRVNRLRTILLNPAPLNPTSAFSTAMPPAPGWFPFKTQYNRFTYAFVKRAGWTVTAGPRNAIASEHLGLPKPQFQDFRRMLASTPVLTTVSKHVVQRPDDWPAHNPITGYLYDDDPDWTAPQDLRDFLDEGQAPVYIGFGSMPDSQPERTTRTIIEAVQRSGQRAVILTGWAGLGLNDSPPNIHMLKYAPHSWLFPRMAAVVHHGGSGTTASGLRAGLPTAIVPHNGDQPYWGRRVKELGVGAAPIPRKKLRADNPAAAITEITTSRIMQATARALGAQIQQEDGVAEALRWVEHFVSWGPNRRQQKRVVTGCIGSSPW